MAIKVFFSFSGKDSKRLHIEEIAYSLEEKTSIEKVYIFTRDVTTIGQGDIIKYMNSGVKDCDIIVLFCTENSANSDPVYDEWGTFQYKGKPIIPVVESDKCVPDLIQKRLRVKISEVIVEKSTKKIVEELYNLIINSLKTKTEEQEESDEKFDEKFLLEKAKESRADYNTNCTKYLESLDDDVQAVIKEKSPLIGEESFTYPAIELFSNIEFFDTICSLISHGMDKILIFPSGMSQEIEGVGRTSLLLQLLGYDLKYNHLFGLEEPKRKIKLDMKEKSRFSLLASDMLYIGLVNDSLCAVPTRGEIISFIWDIARNVYRSSVLDYKKDKHRREGRSRLKKIFQNIELKKEFIRNIYGKIDDYYFPNKIYILKRERGRYLEPPIIKKIKSREQIKEKLRISLLVSLSHGSNFWKRKEENINETVNKIVNNLDLSTIEIYEIEVTFPDNRLPPYVFDDIREIIEKGNIEEEIRGKIEQEYELGTRYHNYRIYQNLADAYKLDLLVTSGQKFFNDISIWEKLSQGRGELKFKILFLDPKSKAAKNRETEAYQKYNRETDYLINEINDTIDEIKRMTDYLNENFPNTNLQVECRLYQEKPIFRMTFINNNELLLATYSEEKRTGSKTKFFIIKKEEQTELFNAFRNEYNRIFDNAKPV